MTRSNIGWQSALNTALTEQQCFASNNMTVISHSSYSPDLAPCDFFIFHKIRNLEVLRFDTAEDIQAAS